LGYVETHENMTDREVQKFAIDFSRSNVLDLDSTKRLDFRPDKDSASLSESSSEEENDKHVHLKTNNVLKGMNFS
jgi:ABC-type Zn uptake system ZnuABC Zn-binding protein ZnuA